MAILEDILDALRANTAALNAHTAALGAPALGAPALGAPAAAPAPLETITSDTITALIQPHIGNPAIKDALGAAMRGMGINNLPETQPHQYGGLYAAFKTVLAQFGIANMPSQQAPTPPPSSII